MSRSLGISVQAFDKWGVPIARRVGRETFYTVDDVVENRLNHLQERINREQEKEPVEGPTAAELAHEQLLLVREQRIKLELANSATRRETAPVALLDWTLSSAGSQIAAILQAIVPKLKMVAPQLKAADLGLIEREIVKAQNVAAALRVDLDGYHDRDAPGDSPGDPEGAGDAGEAGAA